MYATVFKKAPLAPELGKLYRDKILLVGGSRDEMDSLEVRCGAAFRKNEQSLKAFFVCVV